MRVHRLEVWSLLGLGAFVLPGAMAQASPADMLPAEAAHSISATAGFFSEPGDSQAYEQLISLTAGPFHPQSVILSNGTYNFNYNSGSTQSVLGEAGWSARLFWLAGAVYVSENIAYARLSGAPSGAGAGLGSSDPLSVNLLGLDSRLVHAWEWFPARAIIPFVEGGYQETFYSQSGPTDFDSAQGSLGNLVGGAGLRFWLNRRDSEAQDHVNRYGSLPIFLTFKYNRVFSNHSDLDLADSSYLAGLSIGL